ncbi:MAG: NAD-dependent deacetylase [Woeseia sp.]
MNTDPVIPEALIDALRSSRHVCVLTGSGISAESGVPTFREAQTGLWEKYDPHELATPEAFLKDPELVWKWYRWRRDLVTAVEPNAGHKALVDLAAKLRKLTLITQNVDGLHQRAGSDEVIEFHGNIFEDRCLVEGRIVEDAPDTFGKIPTCPACGGNLRPGVVWFGEAIPEDALTGAMTAASDCELFFSIGTSSLVWPAAGLAETAQQGGAMIVEVNPSPTPQSKLSDYCLGGNAGAMLPELVSRLAAES